VWEISEVNLWRGNPLTLLTQNIKDKDILVDSIFLRRRTLAIKSKRPETKDESKGNRRTDRKMASLEQLKGVRVAVEGCVCFHPFLNQDIKMSD
jgi:hypothetical protein